MARYSPFLGRRVEVHYRAGEILLPASGIFVADSGRSIFLEQSFSQRGQLRHFRWEIPYQYIVRLEEKADAEEVPGPRNAQAISPNPEPQSYVARAAASATGTAPGLLPLHNPPKTA
jgi:hypothetical protein